MNQKYNYEKIKSILLFILMAVFIYGLSNNYNSIDFDFWARLIQGRHVVQTGSVMYRDILSYVPTHTWYDPEWLSSAIIYLIVNKFGLISVTITKFIFILLIFFTTLFTTSYINKKPIEKINSEYFFITMFVLFFSGSMGLLLRCQHFTYLILPVWLYILEKISDNYDNKKSTIYLYLLPILMLLWLNLHGACIAGVGIAVLYVIGRIINRKPIKKYIYALFGTSLMFFINPWGPQYIKFLFDSCFLDRHWIVEWQPTIVSEFVYIKLTICYLIITMILYILKLIITRFKNINYSKLFIIIVTYYLSWAHFKHMPLYVICASIYMYSDFEFLVLKLNEKITKKININKIYQRYITILKDITVFLLVFSLALYYIVLSPIKTSILDPRKLVYPINVAEFIKVNNIKGDMFLPYYYGSYMAYKTYPNIKIFMDGRQEQVYDYDIFDREMYFMYGMEDNKGYIIDEYVPDLYLTEDEWDYSYYLKNNPDYKLIFKDARYSLYIKKELAKDEYKDITYTNTFDKDTIFETNLDFRKK